MKLIPISERKGCRCWFCRTDKSVKYEVKIALSPSYGEGRYVHVVVCNKCALIHNDDLTEEAVV